MTNKQFRDMMTITLFFSSCEVNRLGGPYEVLGIAQDADEMEIRRAYRVLAKRWHPDRFADGPERLWAEQRMIQINLAYHDALVDSVGRQLNAPNELAPEGDQLDDIRKIIEAGQFSAARQALVRLTTRTAEWNYLFGTVLLRLGEYEKSVLYFGIATRKQPANHQYRVAFASAEIIRNEKNRRRPFSAWFSRAKGN